MDRMHSAAVCIAGLVWRLLSGMDGWIMKNTSFFLCLLFLVLAPTAVSAQGRCQVQEGVSRSPRGCLSITEMELTTEQRKAVQSIESQYGERINQLQNKLMAKRLEIQQVFRDPRADEGVIRAKAVELADLQNQCRQARLDYRLAVRALLSAEQLQAWCTSMEPCPMKRGGKP
jgi:Spy/CpxP family protein refolding chaperone